jgi:hypothetical protein
MAKKGGLFTAWLKMKKETKRQMWDRIYSFALRKGHTRQEARSIATERSGFKRAVGGQVKFVQGGMMRPK